MPRLRGTEELRAWNPLDLLGVQQCTQLLTFVSVSSAHLAVVALKADVGSPFVGCGGRFNGPGGGGFCGPGGGFLFNRVRTGFVGTLLLVPHPGLHSIPKKQQKCPIP